MPVGPVRKALPIVLFAGLALLATGYLVTRLWVRLGVEISGWGWLAYGVGGMASLALSGGLFFLLFRSARDGHDETGGNDPTRTGED